MLRQQIEMSDVIYNAAEQAFEARVTIHSDTARVRYACSLPAPITTSFEEAARGLRREAFRQARSGAHNASYMRPVLTENASRWPERIASSFGAHAA